MPSDATSTSQRLKLTEFAAPGVRANQALEAARILGVERCAWGCTCIQAKGAASSYSPSWSTRYLRPRSWYWTDGHRMGLSVGVRVEVGVGVGGRGVGVGVGGCSVAVGVAVGGGVGVAVGMSGGGEVGVAVEMGGGGEVG